MGPHTGKQERLDSAANRPMPAKIEGYAWMAGSSDGTGPSPVPIRLRLRGSGAVALTGMDRPD